jgi:hypothetical protein
MTKPKLIGIALLMMAAGPFACAIRYKNPPGPAPADPSAVRPFGAVPWRELPVLYSGDTAATAGPSALVSGSAAASVGAPTAVATAAATVVPLPMPTAELELPPPPPPPSVPPSTPPPAPGGEPTCEQLVAKMGRILHGSGAQPLPPEQAQKMLEDCRQAKQKAPAEWRTCTQCMLRIDDAKPELKACRTPCEAMEKKARGGS